VVFIGCTASASDRSDHAAAGEDRHRARGWQRFAARHRRHCRPEHRIGLLHLDQPRVERLNAAAATAFAREVSMVRKPVRSPFMVTTSRPPSSTTDTVMAMFIAAALANAPRAARSAISSVISSICVLLNGSNDNGVMLAHQAKAQASRVTRKRHRLAGRKR
jgi:hypothetical protein